MAGKEKTTMSYDLLITRSIPTPASRKGQPGNLGFTIVELILVMAIIAILAVLAMPVYDKIKEKAREIRATEEIRGLEKTIAAYTIDNGGTLPVSLAGAPKDPWGNFYQYATPANGKTRRFILVNTDLLNGDYDLYSKGSNGASVADVEETDSHDDIVRAGEGSFVGRWRH
ncbi:MAG TPA: prepilin-type N-terminal cleavage/methylation domain-containing protein [Geomonas sp.]